jgi:hypothetical protein
MQPKGEMESHFKAYFIITQVKHIVDNASSCVSLIILAFAFACLGIDGVCEQIVGWYSGR